MMNATTQQKEESYPKPKYGPLVTFPQQKVWSRFILVVGVVLVAWYSRNNRKHQPEINDVTLNEPIFLSQKDVIENHVDHLPCSIDDYKINLNNAHGHDNHLHCLPEKCGRVVTDELISPDESQLLFNLASLCTNIYKSDDNNTFSTFDLHSGMLSNQKSSINVYSLKNVMNIFSPDDFSIYKIVKTKVQHAISHHFGIDYDKIFLTKPTVFTQITNNVSSSDEVINDNAGLFNFDDKKSKNFHFQSIIYLSDYGIDFENGNLEFSNNERIILTLEPRKGRILLMTAGGENSFNMKQINSGVFYSFVLSFTCDSNLAVSDSNFNNIFQSPE